MGYLICMLPIALLAWLIISDIVNEKRRCRCYQEYIDSIRVGDIFEPKYYEHSHDPFRENSEFSEYSEIIVDIKQNYKGDTWVKYKYLNLKDSEFANTEELHSFVKYNDRVRRSEI